MSESTDGSSTWGQALQLWFWTNVGGFIGVLLSLGLFAGMDSNHRSSSSDLSLVGLIGLIAAVPSLVVVPIAYGTFRGLLRIADYWPRLLATAAVITGFFLLIVMGAATAIMGSKFSLAGIMSLGGWAYWVSALGAAAFIYRQGLFRRNASAEVLTAAEPDEPTNW